MSVSTDFFSLLRVRALLGRTFADAEEVRGRDKVVVLRHGVWRRHLEGIPTSSARQSHSVTRSSKSSGCCQRISASSPGRLLDAAHLCAHPLGERAAGAVPERHRAPRAGRHVGRGAVRTGYPRASTGRAAPQQRRVGRRSLPPSARTSPTATVYRCSYSWEQWRSFCSSPAAISPTCCCCAWPPAETAVRAALGAGQWRLIRPFLMEGAILAALGTAAGLLVASGSLATDPTFRAQRATARRGRRARRIDPDIHPRAVDPRGAARERGAGAPPRRRPDLDAQKSWVVQH